MQWLLHLLEYGLRGHEAASQHLVERLHLLEGMLALRLLLLTLGNQIEAGLAELVVGVGAALLDDVGEHLVELVTMHMSYGLGAQRNIFQRAFLLEVLELVSGI